MAGQGVTGDAEKSSYSEIAKEPSEEMFPENIPWSGNIQQFVGFRPAPIQSFLGIKGYRKYCSNAHIDQ